MHRKYIAIVSALLSILMVVPTTVSYADTVVTDDSETVIEDGDEKTIIKTVTIETTEEDEESEDEGDYRDEPGREPTAYDKYRNFDRLMKKERGSQYVYKEEHTVYFEIDEDGAEVRVSIHHTEGEDESQEYFVYDENGNEVDCEIEYLPNEIVLILRNVHKGDKFTFVTKNKGLDGIYITQLLSTAYSYDEKWTDSSIPEFDAFGYYNYTEEVYRSLMVKDNITEAQLDRFLQEYPLIPEGSLLKRPGVAHAFMRIQDEYGVSAIGLLAIATLESAYGTSHIATAKQNLFGWGAVDSNPFDGAWDWSDLPTDEAIYKALNLIVVNYPLGRYKQDCFYTMRWNNDKHQYCTSTSWPNSNAKRRAQFEAYLGLR